MRITIFSISGLVTNCFAFNTNGANLKGTLNRNAIIFASRIHGQKDNGYMERKWTCCLSFRQKLQVNHSLRLATVEIKLFRQTLRLAKAKIKLFSHTLRLDISLGIFQDLSLLLNALEELHCHFALYFSSNIYMMPVYRSYLIVVIKITYIARFPFPFSPCFPSIQSAFHCLHSLLCCT